MARAQRRKYHYVYKTTCTITGKWYIGMHSTDSLDDGYLGSGTHLSRSVKKHGKENHLREILEHCLDREALRLREDEILLALKDDPMCMNIARGGIGNYPGYEASNNSREKNREASLKMWEKRRKNGYIAPPQKPEHVAKRAKANAGKKRTPEQKLNLNNGQAAYYETADPEVLRVRGQKSAKTRKERGTCLGGRPPGIAMKEEQKQHQREMLKGDNRLCVRASCIHCKKETTAAAIKQFHARCAC